MTQIEKGAREHTADYLQKHISRSGIDVCLRRTFQCENDCRNLNYCQEREEDANQTASAHVGAQH